VSPTLPDPLPLRPGEARVDVLGRSLRFFSELPQEALQDAVAELERTFRDMEQAYQLRWGCPPAAPDTNAWLLLGALNLAHRMVRLEREASQQTRNLEQTLSKLLDDVPDDA
jgi:cell division protein ZapA (FtsZ GTPase activity inhibitor)